ncbi:MAG: hypothetical protein U1E65_07335 [Myxococcota bacterium]
MVRVKTEAVETSLRSIFEEKAIAAAGSNRLISKTEAKTLDAYLGRADGELRKLGGPGTRVDVPALVGRAMKTATKRIDTVNAAGPGRVWLSQAEQRALKKLDPELSALTDLAIARLKQPAPDMKAALTSFFSSFSFKSDPDSGISPLHTALPGGTVIDARPQFHPENRASLPAGVLKAYDFFERAESHDWAGVTLQRANVAGFDAYLVFTTTDGDDGYLEVLDKNGAPVLSARLSGEELVGIDEVFGRDRFTENMVDLDEPTATTGLADPAARAAAGQIPLDFVGDLSLSQGQLSFDQWKNLGKIEIPALWSSPRAELGAAALEILWQRSLKNNVQGSAPFVLGPTAGGTLSLGSFTRPSDGKVFEVADWQSNGTGGSTLYFDRTADGRLKLAIDQTNP